MDGRMALVLGATGGIGGELARRLHRTGWTVRALHREADAMAGLDGLDWRCGDALVAEDVTAAAQGTCLIVHAVNPPGYKDWDRLVMPMLESTIAAARSTGAQIVLPGTVYNYGPDALPAPDETSPQNPVTRKGRIRVAMEERLRKEAEAGPGAQPDRQGWRLLRAARREQLVLARAGEARPAPDLDQLSGQSGGRAPMGLPTGCGRDHGAPRGVWLAR